MPVDFTYKTSEPNGLLAAGSSAANWLLGSNWVGPWGWLRGVLLNLCKQPCHAVFSIDLSVTLSNDGYFLLHLVLDVGSLMALSVHIDITVLYVAYPCTFFFALKQHTGSIQPHYTVYNLDTTLWSHYSFHVPGNLSPLTLHVGKTFLLLEMVRLACVTVCSYVFLHLTPHQHT